VTSVKAAYLLKSTFFEIPPDVGGAAKLNHTDSKSTAHVVESRGPDEDVLGSLGLFFRLARVLLLASGSGFLAVLGVLLVVLRRAWLAKFFKSARNPSCSAAGFRVSVPSVSEPTDEATVTRQAGIAVTYKLKLIY
jgi:hypothetical protein